MNIAKNLFAALGYVPAQPAAQQGGQMVSAEQQIAILPAQGHHDQPLPIDTMEHPSQTLDRLVPPDQTTAGALEPAKVWMVRTIYHNNNPPRPDTQMPPGWEPFAGDYKFVLVRKCIS
jgi:hypothetical protein